MVCSGSPAVSDAFSLHVCVQQDAVDVLLKHLRKALGWLLFGRVYRQHNAAADGALTWLKPVLDWIHMPCLTGFIVCSTALPIRQGIWTQWLPCCTLQGQLLQTISQLGPIFSSMRGMALCTAVLWLPLRTQSKGI